MFSYDSLAFVVRLSLQLLTSPRRSNAVTTFPHLDDCGRSTWIQCSAFRRPTHRQNAPRRCEPSAGTAKHCHVTSPHRYKQFSRSIGTQKITEIEKHVRDAEFFDLPSLSRTAQVFLSAARSMGQQTSTERAEKKELSWTLPVNMICAKPTP